MPPCSLRAVWETAYMLDATNTSMDYAAYMPLIVILMLWSIVWKGLALYRAGYNRSPWWFFFLLILNTLGILEILYLFVFGKKKN